MERSCLMIVLLFIGKLQRKHTIWKLSSDSSWLEVFEWTKLRFEVRCKKWLSTLNLAAETSLCQISSWPKPSDYLPLCCCFSKSFLRCTDHSRLTFRDILFHLEGRRTIAKHRLTSSRPKSIGFLAFVDPWPPARSKSYRTLHFTRSYIATRTKNKAQKSTTSADQTKKIQFGSHCRRLTGVNAIFKLSITLLTSSQLIPSFPRL